MRELSKEQIKLITLEKKYALVSKKTKMVWYNSDNKQELTDILSEMRKGGHAIADVLQLVEKDA